MTSLRIDETVRVAILAGGGALPLMIAESVTRRGGRVHIVAIEGEAGAHVEAYPHTWVNFGQASRMFSALKGVQADLGHARNVMVIAGAVKRPDLLRLKPDFGFVKVLFQIVAFVTAGGDDALLTKAIRVFERQGLTVVGVADVAPELLIEAGVLGAPHPDADALADIAQARAVIEAIGDLDIGQACVVEAGRVCAIEGVTGTDRMLMRLAERRAAKRAVLLKAPKPRQEQRVDLPTIGLQTVANARAAGVHGIAVVAGHSIGLQRAQMIAAADQTNMFIAGVASRSAPAVRPVRAFVCDVIGRKRLRAGDRADAVRGAEAVLRLAVFNAGQGAVVTRGHVLGVTADEPVQAWLDTIQVHAPWGLARLQGRRGALVVRVLPGDSRVDIAALVVRVAAAGLAGIALVHARAAVHGAENLAVEACDNAGLFLIALTADDPSLPSISTSHVRR
jgi:DUF1009 family protein